jgi:hypothetical protein
MKSRTTVRTLSVVVGAVIIAGVTALGCSGAGFSASGGDAGMGSGGVSSAGDGGSSGTLATSAGSGGHTSTGGAGAGGTSTAFAGMAGATELGGGGASDAGAGGELESAGSAGAGDGGDTGSAGAAGACNAVPWFPDGDGDHFGRSSGQVVACDPPTSGVWVAKGGDCDDDNPAVFPTEVTPEPQGYTTSSSVLSFDYNCSGIEEADPTAKGLAPNCPALGYLNCAGVGFQGTDRSGPGVNPVCGSKTLVTCTKSALNCIAVLTTVSEGVRCH